MQFKAPKNISDTQVPCSAFYTEHFTPVCIRPHSSADDSKVLKNPQLHFITKFEEKNPILKKKKSNIPRPKFVTKDQSKNNNNSSDKVNMRTIKNESHPKSVQFFEVKTGLDFIDNKRSSNIKLPSRPIPTLGQIYRQDLLDDKRVDDWLSDNASVFLDSPISISKFSSLNSENFMIRSRSSKSENTMASNIPTTEDAEENEKLGQVKREKGSIELHGKGKTYVIEEIQEESNEITLDSNLKESSTTEIQITDTGNKIVCKKPSKESMKSDTSAQTESSCGTTVTEQPTIIIKIRSMLGANNFPSNMHSSSYWSDSIKADFCEKGLCKICNQCTTVSDGDVYKHDSIQDQNKTSFFVEYPSEVLQKTTNFEIEVSSTSKSSGSYRKIQSQNESVIVTDNSNKKSWSSNPSYASPVDTSSFDTAIHSSNLLKMNNDDQINSTIHQDSVESSLIDNFTETQPNFSRPEKRCAHCRRRLRSPRRRFARPFVSLQRHLTIGHMCRKQWKRMWIRTFSKLSKTSSKNRKLIVSPTWIDDDVQTSMFAWKHIGTSRSTRLQKSEAIEVSLIPTPSSFYYRLCSVPKKNKEQPTHIEQKNTANQASVEVNGISSGSNPAFESPVPSRSPLATSDCYTQASTTIMKMNSTSTETMKIPNKIYVSNDEDTSSQFRRTPILRTRSVAVCAALGSNYATLVENKCSMCPVRLQSKCTMVCETNQLVNIGTTTSKESLKTQLIIVKKTPRYVSTGVSGDAINDYSNFLYKIPTNKKGVMSTAYSSMGLHTECHSLPYYLVNCYTETDDNIGNHWIKTKNKCKDTSMNKKLSMDSGEIVKSPKPYQNVQDFQECGTTTNSELQYAINEDELTKKIQVIVQNLYTKSRYDNIKPDAMPKSTTLPDENALIEEIAKLLTLFYSVKEAKYGVKSMFPVAEEMLNKQTKNAVTNTLHKETRSEKLNTFVTNQLFSDMQYSIKQPNFNNTMRSVSVMTSRCILPSLKPACGTHKDDANLSTECFLIYGSPHCIVHRTNRDNSKHKNNNVGRDKSDRKIEKVISRHYLETSTSYKTRFLPSSGDILEALSPIILRVLYESKHVMKEIEALKKIVNTVPRNDTLQGELKKCTDQPQEGGENQTCRMCNNDKIHRKPDNQDTNWLEERVKGQLKSSYEYYGTVLSKQLHKIKRNLQKHIAPSPVNSKYDHHPIPGFCIDVTTMKPSGCEELACQTARHPKIEPMSCCLVSNTMSTIDIGKGHDKDSLRSVYYLLTAVEGRVRRITRNIE